ncbi:MAG: transcriptional regulator, partial [Acidimicrobiales bacterium]
MAVPRPAYAYLLGLYLGDGCLTGNEKDVYRLRIVLDVRYPSIIAECAAAMAQVLPNKVGMINNPGCVAVNAYSKHWPCLFPQHGPGPKHLRPIVLRQWQDEIALDRHPELFLRGLIHSDGYRGINRIKGRYAYPRYLFDNRSDDIRALFLDGCRRVGVHASQS